MNDTVFDPSKNAARANRQAGSAIQMDENQALDLMNSREAADYLRISLSTLNRMESRGIIRPLRTPGGHRRYTLAMLNRCLETLEEDR